LFALLEYEDLFLQSCKAIACGTQGYLRQTFPLQASRVAVVDLGWRGTLQDSLEHLLQSQLGFSGHIQGLYFGLFDGAKIRTPRGSKEGYFCEPGNPLIGHQDDIPLPLVETLLGAPTGSTWEYQQLNGSNWSPLYRDNAFEQLQFNEKILPFQNGTRLPLEPIDTSADPKSLFELLRGIEAKPLRSDFQDLLHWDGMDHDGPGIGLKNHPGMNWI